MAAIVFEARDRRDLCDRFLRYVKVDTQSDENSTTSPSTEKQKDLARMLVADLLEAGATDVRMDEWGYVFATVESNLPPGRTAPVIGLLAHMDTYHATAGGGVKPNRIEPYAGGDIPLPGDPRQVIRVADNPNLSKCLGHTLLTSDGTTLLGADDKAGVAAIVTVADWLRRHPEFPHGRVRIAFTTDEEVGRGTEHFDVAAFGANYAYTLDGSDLGEIEDETFCADSAIVVIEGHDVHPGYAKGKMVNAVRVAAALVAGIPEDSIPETTEGRQPYLHPYDFKGDVNRVELKFLLRAFTEEELRDREASLRSVIAGVERRFPGAVFTVTVKESYRNMAYEIRKDPKVLEYAEEAIRRQGIEPQRKAIRGGTDGARLSYSGLLTPNLWAGSQAFHSILEWVSLDWMAASAETTIQVLGIWAERGSGPTSVPR
jgi:tripeptide aminopeptidase